MTRDEWGGDARNPISYNGWVYSLSNPVNYTDPSGLCPGCFVFLFPGAGNQGDVDDPFGGKQDFNLRDNLGREIDLATELESRTGITVIVIYPYGPGIRTTRPPTFTGRSGSDGNGNIQDAVWPAANDNSPIPYAKAIEVREHIMGGCFPIEDISVDNDRVQITFIGFSGGGQMAYSTAQKLEGRVFVDNLVLFGAPFRAYNGVANIGHIWDMKGEGDTSISGKGAETYAQWDLYNRGYREHSNYWTYNQEQDIYQHGATQCTLFGADYQHYGPGDYFDTDRGSHPFQGMKCSSGETLPRGSPTRGSRSRVEANVSFLINVVGVGRSK